MTIPGYDLLQPFTTTPNGALWMARSRTGKDCLIRFTTTEEAAELTTRFVTLKALDSIYVARLRDVIADGNRVAIVTDFVPGTVLSQWIYIPGAAVQERVRAILRDIALGLKALHDMGLAHGDLSPSNVVIGEDGAVLIDCVLGGGVTEPYAAPELNQSHDEFEGGTDRRPADVWAWGKIAHELGFEGLIVDRALHPDPARRATIDDILADEQIRDAGDLNAIPMETGASNLDPGQMLRIEAARAETMESPLVGKSVGRHARRPKRSWPRIALATVLVVTSAAVMLSWMDFSPFQQWFGGEPDPATQGGDSKSQQVTCLDAEQSLSVLEQVMAERDRAFEELDTDRLATVLVADTDLWEDDVNLMNAIEEAAVTVEGLKTSISDVQVVSTTCPPLVVEATFTQLEYQQCKDSECNDIPAQDPVRLRLTLDGPSWKVREVQSLEPTAS